jgi:hypothetical protein
VDWAKIKAEYIAGGISYRSLAQKYNISFNTLKRVAVKEGWATLRNKAYNKATTKMVNDVASENAKIDDKYYRLVDMLLDKTEEVMVNTQIWQVSGLKEMATTMKYLKECKGIKTDADIREQEARIDKLRKDIEGEKKDTNITITFGDEVKKYGV